jgi:hypothetical protein
VLSVIGCLQIDGWDVAAVFVEAAVVDQSTHSAFASSTSSMVRHGFLGLINSVLYSPLIVSASALS